MSRIDDSGRRVSSHHHSKSAESTEKSAEKKDTGSSTEKSDKPERTTKHRTVRQYAGESSFESAPKKSSPRTSTDTSPQAKVNTPKAQPQAYTAANSTAGTGGAQAPAQPQPLNPASVDAANKDYDQYKNMGAGTTRVFIELMKDHQSDPDYVAQLVNRAKESSPGVLDYMTGPLNGAFQKDSGGNYASGGFDESDRKAIVDSLNTAKAKGYITDQEIRDRAATSPGWQDVAQRMGIPQVGIDPTTAAATAEVSAAQKAYNDADAAVKSREERLAKELSDFGPALTDEQRGAYIKAFRDDPKNKDVYAKQAQAAEALGNTLSKNREALERASISDPQTRQMLYDSMKAVAKSETPKAALEIYKDIATAGPNSTLGTAFAQFDKIDQEVLQPAIGGAAAQFLAENGGDPKSAFAEMEKLVGPILKAKEDYVDPLKDDAKEGLEDIKKGWEALKEASKGNLDPLEDLAADWKEVGEKKGFLAKGLAAASLVMAAGTISDAKSGIDELKEGKYAKAISDLASAGQSGLEIVAGATKALADAGKLAEYTKTGLSFADFAAKLAPGLGVVANGAALVAHLQDSAETKNAGFAIAALGDALGVLGSALEATPGAEPAGLIIGGVGAIVSAGGEVFGNFLEKKNFEDEQRRFLEAAKVPAELRPLLIAADGDRVRELAGDLKLSPQQIQDLTHTYPNLLEGTGRGVVLDNFKKMVSSLGLRTDQVYDLMQSIGKNTGNNPAALEVFFSRLSRDLYPRNGQEWLNAIHDIATDPRNHEDLRLVFGNVDDYLKSQIQGPPTGKPQ